MDVQRKSIHGEWSSRWAFILAATGAAVGLGNVWKFPYITGENGGGAFVLVYLLCITVIGIPVMMAEILIGRRGRRNPASAMTLLAVESGRSPNWGFIGYITICAGFLILSYYSVIAGWALDYIFQSAAGHFSYASAAQIDNLFTQLVQSPLQLIMWHSIIIGTTVLVVARGLEKGLERAVRFMFPAMLLLLFVLLLYAISSGHFWQGFSFLFKPDFSKLTSQGSLAAMGHAFFTLSIATGTIMMYGAYVPRNASIAKAAIAIAIADTSVALIAGLVIFPIVFADQLSPGQGPGLLFKTLPLAFGHIPYGTLFGTLFFVMLVFAALTSAISLLEPTVAWLIERFHLSRARATFLSGCVIWLLGLGTVFSFNIGSEIKWLGLDFFNLLDYLTANIMLPIGGLLVAIFTAWRMKQLHILDELQVDHGFLFKAWRFTMRFITPLAIFMVFLDFAGFLNW